MPQDHATDGSINAVASVTHHYGRAQPDSLLGGPEAGGAQLFYSFYFLSTALHGLHMLVGIGLIAWVCQQIYRGRGKPLRPIPVEIVGLYWSFVDLVWILLFPVLYLIGRV
ncbi:cytochrome c oxidase subunit 3 [Acetobacter oeni]|uniref:cytochrome c oxidase subunit 3 n=1 Tax=Acetobacter oeni TaxID=304077 RepID=UPI001F550883|nr:cytochrome c oxidase subunit 3 [Acetobacter oeni]